MDLQISEFDSADGLGVPLDQVPPGAGCPVTKPMPVFMIFSFIAASRM